MESTELLIEVSVNQKLAKYRSLFLAEMGFEPIFYPKDYDLSGWLDDQIHAMEYYRNLCNTPSVANTAKELVKKSNVKRTGKKTAPEGKVIKPVKKRTTTKVKKASKKEPSPFGDET